MNDSSQINVKGHLRVTDDKGEVLVDKDNAIHPQNMSRVIARGLANEKNGSIWRIAFGNGGTEVTAANQIEYKSPNDGQPPDQSTWDSRLYKEVYSEIIDDGLEVVNQYIGEDPGSSDFNGQRPGGGSEPGYDPVTIPHVSGPGVRSNELGLTSEVSVTCVLNQEEPKGQYISDINTGVQEFESSFVFDEIGLYSAGAQAAAISAYQNVDVSNKVSTDPTPLLRNTKYGYVLVVNGADAVDIKFQTPDSGGTGTGGEFTYGDLCEAFNTQDPTWFTIEGYDGSILSAVDVGISDSGDGSYPSINGGQTFGYLQFKSKAFGVESSIEVKTLNDPETIDLWGGQGLNATPVISTLGLGSEPGVQNDPVNYLTERERLLSHVIFAPVLKSLNRVLTITYTLTISVARTVT
jgi:hypothetical protein